MMQLTQKRIAGSRTLVLGFLMTAVVAVCLLLVAAAPAHASTTFTVNSTTDHADAVLTVASCDTGYQVPGLGGGQEAECTLRAAIEQANYTPGADAINFAIPGSGVKTIAPESALPAITKPVAINGYSQPGAKPNTKAVGSDAVLKIELRESGVPEAGVPDGSGLVIEASNSTVKGLVINRWSNSGILIIGPGATGNRVVGNYLGTDASGTNDLGNDGSGVHIEAGSNNSIGGTTAGARNIISANDYQGIHISGTAATGNKVTGNYIGTDASGARDLGNIEQGVLIYGAPKNIIGGTTAGERNIISANDSEGVLIVGPGAGGNSVTGNYVGTDKNGAAPLGNSGDGVHVSEAANTTIGGTTAAARNVISANNGEGVQIYGNTATGNRVLSNSIFANGLLGIELGADGPTANDAGDADTGPNNLQNTPVLSSAKKSTTDTTTVKGKLNSTPDKTFRVQFFSNPKGTDEGKTFLGQRRVTTDGSGNVSITFSTKKAIRLGQNITATATGPGGNTSEFSAPRRVVTP